MDKEVAVGGAVARLQEQYACYNPYFYLYGLSTNQKAKDKGVIARLYKIDDSLTNCLTELSRDLLVFRYSDIKLDIEKILSILKDMYAPTIDSLTSEETSYAKLLFKNWKLEWMLNYIKDSTLLEDVEYYEKYGLEVDEVVENRLKDMRLFFFTEEELMNLFGDEYFVEC